MRVIDPLGHIRDERVDGRGGEGAVVPRRPAGRIDGHALTVTFERVLSDGLEHTGAIEYQTGEAEGR